MEILPVSLRSSDPLGAGKNLSVYLLTEEAPPEGNKRIEYLMHKSGMNGSNG